MQRCWEPVTPSPGVVKTDRHDACCTKAQQPDNHILVHNLCLRYRAYAIDIWPPCRKKDKMVFHKRIVEAMHRFNPCTLLRSLGLAFPVLALFLCACGTTGSDVVTSASPETTKSIAHTASATPRIANGDKLRITVFNEQQLSGEFIVDESGSLAFPLIGQTKVTGLSVQEIEDTLRKRLDGRYLVNPRISVEVLNQRPFYILGEVAKAGEYPYRPGMNIVGAIATAGGFTPRAATSYVIIRRGHGGEQQKHPVEPTIAVLPGDMITVTERMF